MIAVVNDKSSISGKKINAIKLKKISRDAIFHMRQIFTQRSYVYCDCAATTWSIKYSYLPSVGTSKRQLIFDWGGAHCAFRFNQSVLESFICESLGIDYVPSFNEEISLAFFEVAIADFVDSFEKSTRKRFVLTSSDAGNLPSWAEYSALLTLENSSLLLEVECWTDELGLGFFSSAVKDLEKCKAIPDFLGEVPIPVRFRAGYTLISLRLLRQIEKHDVILIDENFISEKESISVFISENYGFSARLENSKIIVSENLRKIMANSAGIDNSNDLEKIDDLEIRLDFDLGERTVSLSDLRLISPGYVFDLGRDLRKSVVIRANGKIVGHGELVDIDGVSGVSVLSLSSYSL